MAAEWTFEKYSAETGMDLSVIWSYWNGRPRSSGTRATCAAIPGEARGRGTIPGGAVQITHPKPRAGGFRHSKGST